MSVRYQVYTKPYTKTIHINRQSNHPPSIRKQLPKMIENRISVASIDEDAFNSTKIIFQAALKKQITNTKLNLAEVIRKATEKRGSVNAYISTHHTGYQLRLI